MRHHCPLLTRPRISAGLLAFATLALNHVAAIAYDVEPGSTGNTIVLQLDDRSGVLAGQLLDIEVSASTEWIEVVETTVLEGLVQEIEVTFAVDRVATGSTGYLEVVANASSAGIALRRTIPLEVALGVADEQRSFAIDECCLASSGLDPIDPSTTGPALLGNTPNPVTSLTDIVFDLGVSGGTASLRVHNVEGRLLRTIETPPLSAGVHRISWDSRDDSGRDLPSGVYFYTVSSGDWSETRKIQLLR